MRSTFEHNGETLTKEIIFGKAWDKRHPDPSKNYGIGGVELRFHLIGPCGATQFVVSTSWYLEENMRNLMAKHDMTANDPYNYCPFKPMPTDVGYHSYVPMYKDQTPMEDCNLLGGADCYYDGSSLQAVSVFNQFKEEGEDSVWAVLISRYEELKDRTKEETEKENR
jgi:hypothetical protein